MLPTAPLGLDKAPPRLARRRLLQELSKLGLAMAMLPIAGRRVAGAADVIYYTWDLYDDPQFYKTYGDRTGRAPIIQTFVDDREAFEQITAGLAVDLAHPCNGQIPHWRDAGLIRPIEVERLSNWPDLFPVLKAVPGAYADGRQWFLPIDWGNTSVLYRADLVDVAEDSYSLLWDERYAQRISVSSDIADTVPIAALVAGAADPYDLSPADMQSVKAALERQRPLVRFYWSDTTVVEEALASGEIVAAATWNDSFLNLRKRGIPVRYMTPKEGIISYCCGLVLSAQASEIDGAYELMDALLAPEAGKWVIETLGYGHSNRRAFELVDESALAGIGMPRDPSEMLGHGRFEREFSDPAALQTMFSAIMSA